MDLRALQGRYWQPTSTLIPRKIIVVDLDGVLKAWTYLSHHTLDINRKGFELITMTTLALYMLMTRKPNKSLGHDIVTLLLCKKAGF